ncbi:MAG: hypothetical protein SLAVMIC_00545 [uncultured marine phage]|uniref:Uncharacterized protein n=1 Tax=uncultured marine phage TaxID=707152 RepID=A0A8D9CA76_9VIRU|nr:MAG: hypothetical protein SLAVMIC_00545 [uncultured marine phage]
MKNILPYNLFLEKQLEIPFPDLKKSSLDLWLENAIDIIQKDCKPFISELRKEFMDSPVEMEKQDNIYHKANRSKVLWRGFYLKDEDKIVPPLMVERDTNKEGNITFTGGKSMDTYNFGKKTVRSNRRSADMPEEVNDYFDQSFIKYFDFYPRSNGAFCTGSRRMADGYGTPYLVFPIGEYKYIWSQQVSDLYDYTEKTMWFAYTFDPDGVVNDIRDGYANPENLKWYNEKMTDEEIHNRLEKMVDDNIDEIVNTYESNDLKRAIDSGNEITLNCKEYYAISFHPKLIEEFYNGVII